MCLPVAGGVSFRSVLSEWRRSPLVSENVGVGFSGGNPWDGIQGLGRLPEGFPSPHDAKIRLPSGLDVVSCRSVSLTRAEIAQNAFVTHS